ncbi:MAG: tRNA dihydrouridine(20/20a) synthase DusA, partial [Immundisolibacteraceae bacterium]|nr:tRNA dihydrouridine(20/20a) synthase DusA [Immundisolibacteraceae bacterium]
MTHIDQRLSVAPMLDCTDRHARYLLRLLTRHTVLYTEMVVAQALIHGDRRRFMAHHQCEHPLVLQLGGSDPGQLAMAATIGEQSGYDQINLNVGCPSERVKAGRFGAALMAEPAYVGDLFSAMQAAVKVEVTIKCRIGIDDLDSWEHFLGFVESVAAAGCKTFIVHARKAWLKGLSPKQNRTLPPLNYDFVRRLKREHPELNIIINGGIESVADAGELLGNLDGVMIGRAAYHNPWMLLEADRQIYGDDHQLPSRMQVLEQYMAYMRDELQQGVPLRPMARHLIGFYQGSPGAKNWRRCIADEVGRSGGLARLDEAIQIIEQQ